MIVSSGSAFLPWQAKYSLEDYVKKEITSAFIINDFNAELYITVKFP